ncbi:MAG: hypothetical protein ACTS42_01250 [Candidatus Hodgkinia cicadicola]
MLAHSAPHQPAPPAPNFINLSHVRKYPPLLLRSLIKFSIRFMLEQGATLFFQLRFPKRKQRSISSLHTPIARECYSPTMEWLIYL